MAQKKLPLEYRLKRVIKKILGRPVREGNALKVRHDDRFIVSYPKSGNTWMRFLVGNLLSNEPVNFFNVEYLVPDMYWNTDKHMHALPSPRYIKSHEPYDPRYNKVVYLIRDGRDVAVSYYYHLKRENRMDLEFSDYLKKFAAGKLDDFGTWGDNINSWMQNVGEQSNRFLMIRYEDLIRDAQAELFKVCQFLGLPKSIEQIDLAVQDSSFEKMAEHEKRTGKENMFKNTNQKIKFIRSGKVGSWRDMFTERDKDLFKSCFGFTLVALKYEENQNW
ncbi:Sulfotransferase domain-containing protein [Desulfotomaculum arcticum]|uniref:Sulfotransferase domain-containing protein n=1 Tax=Desulfotruncus arcticus DSM 17038 TaxID=1121424 RepID=A0A1I2VKB7_9FIRM|nr:sulfotransferase domain-containing protein [Desulfotruncus arcticus]SFG89785.1 Sulfotransferase domain-containing protein [Desulfotomaculum arcticum] [Desulfotruncus arcticus DSM 17038]